MTRPEAPEAVVPRPPHDWVWGSTPHLPTSVRYLVTCSRCGRSVSAREYNRDRSTWLRECPTLSDKEQQWLLWCNNNSNNNEQQPSLFG